VRASRALAILLSFAALEAAGCSRKVRVGAIVSSTGAAAMYGERVRKGIELAVQDVNASGGVGGRHLEVVYRDDATNPQVGLQMARELVSREGVRILIGAVSSAVTLEIAPYCEQRRVLLISPTASAPQLTQAGEFIFRNYPSDLLEGASMADFARDLGLERVGVFAVANEYGEGLLTSFSERLQCRQRPVLRSYEFREGDTAALAPSVEELKALNPDGVYIIGYRHDVADLVKRIRAAGIDAVALTSSSVTLDIAKLAGPAAENLVFPLGTSDPDPDDPVARPFFLAYRDRYDEEADGYAAHGYDSLQLLVHAMERAGSTDPERVREALLSIDHYRGANGWASFDENGDVIEYPRLLIVHDGQPVPYQHFLNARNALRPRGSR
jgi:branched-chain amino acid transport system substrate-binding protein